MKKLEKELKEYKMLMRSIPAPVFALFVVGVVVMNLLANKGFNITTWLVADCGILLSGIAFMTLDVIVKRFGAKASFQVTVVASLINLLMCGVFFLASCIHGAWGESYVPGYEAIINTALDNTIGGTWYVLLGSTIAFLVSSAVNGVTNVAIGKVFSKTSFGHFAIRSFVSTMVGQFTDNFTFAMLVSRLFFGWTLRECVICSLVGALLELFMEVFFSPIGYKLVRIWEKEDVGKEYLDYVKASALE